MGKSAKKAPPSEEKVLPILRCNREELNCIFGLFAAVTEFTKCEEVLQRRVKAIPNGWRDLRLLSGQTYKLVEKILRTVPVEKLQGVMRMLPNMQYKTCFGKNAAVEEDETIIKMSEMDAIVAAAHEKCVLCDKDCNKCALGKSFDHVLADDRDGGSWAMINIMADRKEKE